MSENNNVALAKKQAELKKQKTNLRNNENGYKTKRTQALSLKSKKKLTPTEKATLSKLQGQVNSYPNIIAKNKENIVHLEKTIAELKQAEGKVDNSSQTATDAEKAVAAVKAYSKKNNPVTPKVKFVGKICITIDHFGLGKRKTTKNVVAELKKAKIPVTVFVQCTGGAKLMTSDAKIKSANLSRQKIQTFQQKELEMINDIKGYARLGVHLLGILDVKRLNEESAAQKQIDNIEYIKSIIGNTGVASYHGTQIEKAGGIQNKLVQGAFRCIRGTESIKPEKLKNAKYTPVFYSTNDINKDRVTNFFFHSHEIIGNKRYQNLLQGVKLGIYKVVSYC